MNTLKKFNKLSSQCESNRSWEEQPKFDDMYFNDIVNEMMIFDHYIKQDFEDFEKIEQEHQGFDIEKCFDSIFD